MPEERVNPFAVLPQELIYHILDYLPLKNLVTTQTVNKDINTLISDYLCQELHIKNIICGANFSFILLKNGRVLGMGDNQKGQLGLGKECKQTTFPVEVLGMGRIEQIHVGFAHTVMLGKNGAIWVMGDNSLQHLPLLSENTFVPQQLLSKKKIKNIAVKDFTTSLFTDTNEFLNFGNEQLKPKIVNNTLVLLPDWVNLPTDKEIVAVSVAKEHALVLTKSGDVYGIGDNNSGSLGKGGAYVNFSEWTKLFEHVSKIQATSTGSILLTQNHELMVAGLNKHGQLSPQDELIIPDFKQVSTGVKLFAAGDFHTLYLSESNKPYAMGSNEHGQLGLGSPIAPPGHSLILPKKFPLAKKPEKHFFGSIGFFFKDNNAEADSAAESKVSTPSSARGLFD
ncbi:MAG: hypothetical protein P4L79_09390 [Legionella sp.]|uniref:F-box protein n=1 Tax=Legionella sp. TaxID=459 RepID=UPI0028414058|nr:hypothetical protein [Legionella sp.]